MSRFAGHVRVAVFLVLLLGALGLLPGVLAGCGSSAGDNGSGASGVTDQQVIDLANKTAKALEKDTAGTIAAINAGDKAYADSAHPDLYAFVDDMNMTVVAHPNASVRGTNVKGQADVTGKLWRDQILESAAAGKSGWMDYVYAASGGSGYVKKACYFEPVTGSDGVKYIACATHDLGPYTGEVQTTGSTAK
jgi:hypothetical protein